MRRRLPALPAAPAKPAAGPARATRFALIAGLAAATLLAGCAAPTVTRLHSLLPAQTLTAGATATPPLAIHLAQVTVPVAVDQAPWLVRLPDGSLLQLEQDRWTSPLHDELRAALREILAQRWGAVDARGVPPAWRIVVEVTRFESITGLEARLEAHWTVAAVGTAAARAPATSCRAVLRETVGAGTTAMAAGHQRAVARLADRIGRQLRAAAAGQVPACEADGA